MTKDIQLHQLTQEIRSIALQLECAATALTRLAWWNPKRYVTAWRCMGLYTSFGCDIKKLEALIGGSDNVGQEEIPQTNDQTNIKIEELEKIYLRKPGGKHTFH